LGLDTDGRLLEHVQHELNVFNTWPVMPTADSPYVIAAYLVYLVLSVAATVWVARTLYRSGRAFLVDAFRGNETLADSVNHLLVVGFYLINLGWIVMTLKTSQSVWSLRAAFELLSDKIGTVLFVLGLMHFFNLYLFNRFRRRAIEQGAGAPFPIPPTSVAAR
jgi:hypothetical protein